MSTLQCRSSIALTLIVVALSWSKAAEAQVTNDPGPPREPGGLVNNLLTGVEYDLINQAVAERRLQHAQAKLRRDTEQCNRPAVDNDVRRINNLKYRIVVDEWLIRKNMLQDPGCYPYPLRLDPMSCAAIADVARPPQAPPTHRFVGRGW